MKRLVLCVCAVCCAMIVNISSASEIPKNVIIKVNSEFGADVSLTLNDGSHSFTTFTAGESSPRFTNAVPMDSISISAYTRPFKNAAITKGNCTGTVTLADGASGTICSPGYVFARWPAKANKELATAHTVTYSVTRTFGKTPLWLITLK